MTRPREDQFIRRLRRLLGGLLIVMGSYVVLLIVYGEPFEAHIGRTVIGATVVSVRVLWSRDGLSEIAWDDLPGLPRFLHSEGLLQVELPLWPFMILGTLLYALFVGYSIYHRHGDSGALR